MKIAALPPDQQHGGSYPTGLLKMQQRHMRLQRFSNNDINSL
jgi:hypothetical protein